MAENIIPIKEFMEIPDDFHNSDTRNKFTHCIDCNKYLLDSGVLYVIEKAVKQNVKYKTSDIIFEYAMCWDCMEVTRKSFSQESMQRMNEYFDQNLDVEKRRSLLIRDGQTDYKDWISHCLFKGTPRELLTEYQLACQCDGPYMLFYQMPLLIGGAAIDEITMLLSDQTIGEINRFYKKFFPVPTEFEPFFDDRKVLIL